MLRWRLLLGTLLVAALAGLCWLDAHGVAHMPIGGWLFPAALVVGIAGVDEMLGLLAARPEQPQPSRDVVHFGSLAILLGNAVSIYGPRNMGIYPAFTAAFAAVLLAIIVEIVRYEEGGRPIMRLALTFFIWVYVPVLLSCVIQLRTFQASFGWAGHDSGMFALASMIAVVKMGDTGAYTIGRLFGRSKMAPRLSPGKTWAGGYGAVVFAAITSWAIFALAYRWNWYVLGTGYENVQPTPNWPIGRWQWVYYGVALGVVGLIGDLAESLIKRDCGQKDSSRWMPGFGGVLDLLDSILLAAPVAWAFWMAGLLPG